MVYQQQKDKGIYLEIDKKAPQEPLNITVLSEGDKTITHSRVHIHIPSLAEVNINIHFRGHDASAYANLCEFSFSHEAGSITKVCILTQESSEAMTLTGFQHTLKRDSRLKLQLLNGENKLTRHRLNIELNEENAEVDVSGIGSLAQSGTLHHHLTLYHNVSHCRSKQLFKTALGGKARSSFDGTIFVAEKAIQTEADQLSRYLLLSP